MGAPKDHLDEAAQLALVQKLIAELPEADALLVQGGEEGLTEHTARRWLVARKWVFADAMHDLLEHAKWRANYVPNGRIDESEVTENLEASKNFLQGYCHAGRPVAIVYVKRHLPQKLEAMKRYICYCIDGHNKLCDYSPRSNGKSSGILYLTGMTLANSCLTSLRALFDLLQSHYVERLHTLWLYDSPMVFLALWKLVSPFVDPVTRKKVIFVYPKSKEEAAMLAAIPPEILPAELGGTGEWRRVDKVWELILESRLEELLVPGQKL